MTTEPKDVRGGDEPLEANAPKGDPFHEVSDYRIPGVRYAEPGWLARSMAEPKASDPAPVREAVAWRWRMTAEDGAHPSRWLVCEADPRGDPSLRGLRIEARALVDADPLPVSREAVARIIDPMVYELTDALNKAEGEPEQLRRDATARRDERLAKALAKADAILALTGETSRG